MYRQSCSRPSRSMIWRSNFLFSEPCLKNSSGALAFFRTAAAICWWVRAVSQAKQTAQAPLYKLSQAELGCQDGPARRGRQANSGRHCSSAVGSGDYSVLSELACPMQQLDRALAGARFQNTSRTTESALAGSSCTEPAACMHEELSIKSLVCCTALSLLY